MKKVILNTTVTSNVTKLRRANNILDHSLIEKYNGSPVIRALAQITLIGGLFDTVITENLNKRRREKFTRFFEELGQGNLMTNESTAATDDFLHAHFSTVNYVLRTRTNEKIVRFAKILRGLYLKKLNIEEFEDYTAILNDISDREFYILSKKLHYEKINPVVDESEKIRVLHSYWESFKEELCQELQFDEDELSMMLLRLQRTGCYEELSGVFDDNADHKGVTTKMFQKIYSLVAEHTTY